jgi:hypothetical protein
MGALSKALQDQKGQEEKQQNVVVEKNLDLNVDEVKFILAKLAQIEFKGVEIEFTYNLIIKLQELFKKLNEK